jgi:ubiquitin-like domain-containing CTD phosphatase 1
VYDLRAAIERQTEVPPAAQKIIGLCRTQLRSDMDSTRIGTLNIKDGVKFTLVGPSADEADVSYPARGSDGKMLDPAVDPRNLRRVQQVIKEFPLTVMNEPREGKRLLVLDLDYSM